MPSFLLVTIHGAPIPDVDRCSQKPFQACHPVLRSTCLSTYSREDLTDVTETGRESMSFRNTVFIIKKKKETLVILKLIESSTLIS